MSFLTFLGIVKGWFVDFLVTKLFKSSWGKLRTLFGDRKVRISKTVTKIRLPAGVDLERITEMIEVPLSEQMVVFANGGVKRILTIPGVPEALGKREVEVLGTKEKVILEIHRLLGKGDGKLELWDCIGAEEAYRAAYNASLKTEDKSLQSLCLCLLAGTMGIQAKFSEGMESVERALELKPGDAWIWGVKGFILWGLTRYEEAVSSFDRATQLRPTHSETWRVKGWILSDLKLYDEAVPCFEKALELNSKNAEAWIEKGSVLLVLKRHTEALRSFQRASELKSDDARAWFGKGSTLMLLEQYEKALPAFERTLELIPGSAMPWHCKGVVLDGLGRYEEAIPCYGEAIRLKPDDADAWYNKGLALTILGRGQEAIPCLDEALKLSHNDCKAWIVQGVALFQLGRLKEAKQSFDKALPLRAQHPDKGKLVFYSLTHLLLIEGLDSIASGNTNQAHERALELIQLMKESEKADMANVVDEEIAEFKKRLLKRDLNRFRKFEIMLEEAKNRD